MTTSVLLTKKSAWSFFYRFGLFDPVIPINYDLSIKGAFEALAPKPTNRVLDVGCGNGRLFYHARSWLAEGGRLVGVELSKGGAESARYRTEQLGFADQITVKQGDMRQLKELELGVFDGAVSHFSIYMLQTQPERQAAVKQVGNLLKPGAKFVFAVPSETWSVREIFADACQVESKRSDINWLHSAFRQWVVYPMTAIGFRDLEKGLDEDLFHRYTPEEITEHLTKGGFEDIQIERIYGGNGYRAVARKI
ncbi:class I SAM-dependent methyltransferase [Pelatocladus sp. BLCC-F211]|uniref:class I SAM-dependent methyltransferase n=1 Tax=Pelatocladus sp. BLCC-F211 TaxID=3342752 RepID=UPI0035B98B64